MDKPTFFQTVMDRYDARTLNVLEEDAPVLRGPYRAIYHIFVAVTIAQFVYASAAHWDWLKLTLERFGLNIFAPVSVSLMIFSQMDTLAHMHMFIAFAALSAMSSIQDKDYGVVRWSVVLIGALAVNYGVLSLQTENQQPFVLYLGCVAFIVAYASSIRLTELLLDRKAINMWNGSLATGVLVIGLIVGLVIELQYLPSVFAGMLMGLWVVFRRPAASL